MNHSDPLPRSSAPGVRGSFAPRRSGVLSEANRCSPERVALQVIAAICDIFSGGPEDLITVTAADVRARIIDDDN
jgi:hypothetical protein